MRCSYRLEMECIAQPVFVLPGQRHVVIAHHIRLSYEPIISPPVQHSNFIHSGSVRTSDKSLADSRET